MLFYTVGQSRVFLMMLCVGLGIGAWYSLLEVMRRLQQAGAALSLAMDVLFGVGAAALIVWGAMRICYGELRLYSMRICYGELRLYSILGAVCGCLLFRGAVLPPARFLARKVRQCLRAHSA